MQIRRTISFLLTLCIFPALCGGASLALDRQDTKAISAAPGDIALERKIAELINDERAKHGMEPLKYVADISEVARVKSQDMVKYDYFSHSSPVYGSPFKMMESFGLHYTAAGENIARGQRTAQAVMSNLMNSPGHRDNILSPIFTQIGIGAARLPNGTYCFTQLFVKR